MLFVGRSIKRTDLGRDEELVFPPHNIQFTDRMNRFFAVFLAVLSITYAAEAKTKEFTIGNFFAGSWVIANRKVNLETGEVIGEPVFSQYNVTKTNDNEYDIFELEAGSYHRKPDADQVVMMTSSSLSCSISQYNAEKDGFDTLSELSFVSLVPSESYVRFLCESNGVDCFWQEPSQQC